MEQIKCNKCGSIDDYYTELKSNNNVARCNQCDSFIKNIPYQTEHVFYFGKYKDKKVNEVEDIPYLQWVLKNTKPSKSMREAIEKQISSFANLAR